MAYHHPLFGEATQVMSVRLMAWLSSDDGGGGTPPMLLWPPYHWGARYVPCGATQ
jgi:hypothetical protein